MAGEEQSDRRRMLDTAAEMFRAADYSVLGALHMDSVAREAGIDPARARRMFGPVEDFRKDVVEHLLRHDDAWGSDDLRELIRAVDDGASDLEQSVADLVGMVWMNAAADPTFPSFMALVPYAGGSDQIRDSASSICRDWDREVSAGLAIAAMDRGVLFRSDWISVKEFATLVLAIMDGLALRRLLVNAGADVADVPDALPVRAIAAVLASMLEPPENLD